MGVGGTCVHGSVNRRAELPRPLRDTPFHISTALAQDVSRSRLRASDLVAPTRGVRIPRAADETTGLDAQVAAFTPALTAGQFFSHETALALYGVPMPHWPYQPAVHVSSHRPAPAARRIGVVGHRLQTREPAQRLLNGIPVEDPVRAWRQCGRSWTLDDLVAAADHLITPRVGLASIDELRAEVSVMGDLGDGRLRRALAEARVGAESTEETRLRLLLTRAGLPEAELNTSVYDEDGVHLARLDLLFRRYRVAVEYDGRIHAEDIAQLRRDADRWDALRAAGLTVVRILSHHLRPDPQVAVRKVADALIAAGWRPLPR